MCYQQTGLLKIFFATFSACTALVDIMMMVTGSNGNFKSNYNFYVFIVLLFFDRCGVCIVHNDYRLYRLHLSSANGWI